jgi:hypothetical protein
VWLATALIKTGLPVLYKLLEKKILNKTNLQGISKLMPNKAVASHTHSQTGIYSFFAQVFKFLKSGMSSQEV